MKFKLTLKRILSFTLSLLMVFISFQPGIIFAENIIDSTLEEIEYYNGEEVVLSVDGYIYTSISENDDVIIKAYSEDNILVEEVILDKENNIMKCINYNYEELNFRSAPLIETIDLNEYQINKDNNHAISPFSSNRRNLGRTTYRSRVQPYYRAMSVEYSEYEDHVSFSVPVAANTVPKFVAFVLGYIPMPSNVIGKIISGLVTSKIIEKVGNDLYFKQFDVSAYMKESTFWGTDGNYRGSINGKFYEVETRDSKYYKDKFLEGIYLDPVEWGNGSISRALQYEVYGSFMSNLSYVSEGR